MKKVFFYVSLISIIFLAGCSQNVNLSSYADYDFLSRGFRNGDTFAIAEPKGDLTLLDKQIIQKITFILKNRGYQVVDPKKADFILSFDYSMSSEKRKEYVEQEIGRTTVKSQAKEKSNSNYGSSSSQADNTVVAAVKVMLPVEVTYYKKSMNLSVQQVNSLSKSSKDETVWTAVADIFNKESDLRYSVDYLLAGLFQHFGKNTKKAISFTVNDKNKYLKEVRDFIIPKEKKK